MSRQPRAVMGPSTATVLVADDDSDIVELIRFRLERGGHHVLTATDGVTAVKLALAERPDLILLDVMMPGMSGYDVCQAIRLDDELHGVGIIMLTARAQERDLERGFGCGADDYLTKPFAPPELLSRVDALLKRTAPRSS